MQLEKHVITRAPNPQKEAFPFCYTPQNPKYVPKALHWNSMLDAHDANFETEYDEMLQKLDYAHENTRKASVRYVLSPWFYYYYFLDQYVLCGQRYSFQENLVLRLYNFIKDLINDKSCPDVANEHNPNAAPLGFYALLEMELVIQQVKVRERVRVMYAGGEADDIYKDKFVPQTVAKSHTIVEIGKSYVDCHPKLPLDLVVHSIVAVIEDLFKQFPSLVNYLDRIKQAAQQQNRDKVVQCCESLKVNLDYVNQRDRSKVMEMLSTQQIQALEVSVAAESRGESQIAAMDKMKPDMLWRVITESFAEHTGSCLSNQRTLRRLCIEHSGELTLDYSGLFYALHLLSKDSSIADIRTKLNQLIAQSQNRTLTETHFILNCFLESNAHTTVTNAVVEAFVQHNKAKIMGLILCNLNIETRLDTKYPVEIKAGGRIIMGNKDLADPVYAKSLQEYYEKLGEEFANSSVQLLDDFEEHRRKTIQRTAVIDGFKDICHNGDLRSICKYYAEHRNDIDGRDNVQQPALLHAHYGLIERRRFDDISPLADKVTELHDATRLLKICSDNYLASAVQCIIEKKPGLLSVLAADACLVKDTITLLRAIVNLEPFKPADHPELVYNAYRARNYEAIKFLLEVDGINLNVVRGVDILDLLLQSDAPADLQQMLISRSWDYERVRSFAVDMILSNECVTEVVSIFEKNNLSLPQLLTDVITNEQFRTPCDGVKALVSVNNAMITDEHLLEAVRMNSIELVRIFCEHSNLPNAAVLDDVLAMHGNAACRNYIIDRMPTQQLTTQHIIRVANLDCYKNVFDKVGERFLPMGKAAFNSMVKQIYSPTALSRIINFVNTCPQKLTELHSRIFELYIQDAKNSPRKCTILSAAANNQYVRTELKMRAAPIMRDLANEYDAWNYYLNMLATLTVEEKAVCCANFIETFNHHKTCDYLILSLFLIDTDIVLLPAFKALVASSVNRAWNTETTALSVSGLLQKEGFKITPEREITVALRTIDNNAERQKAFCYLISLANHDEIVGNLVLRFNNPCFQTLYVDSRRPRTRMEQFQQAFRRALARDNVSAMRKVIKHFPEQAKESASFSHDLTYYGVSNNFGANDDLKAYVSRLSQNPLVANPRLIDCLADMPLTYAKIIYKHGNNAFEAARELLDDYIHTMPYLKKETNAQGDVKIRPMFRIHPNRHHIELVKSLLAEIDGWEPEQCTIQALTQFLRSELRDYAADIEENGSFNKRLRTIDALNPDVRDVKQVLREEEDAFGFEL